MSPGEVRPGTSKRISVTNRSKWWWSNSNSSSAAAFCMKTRLLFQHGLGSLALMSSTAWAASNVSFSQSVESVEAYDYVEVTLNVDKPDARNPLLDLAVTATFSETYGSERRRKEGA